LTQKAKTMKKEIAKVIVSEPYQKYQTIVSYSSMRKITTFEWLILELLASYEKTNFSILNLAALFNDIFFIGDFEKTILPILKSLKSKGMLSYDDSDDYENLTLQDIELSGDGKAFLYKGEMPNDPKQEEVAFSYDFFNKKLELHYKNRKTQPTGIELCANEEPTMNEFEAIKILESQKNQFNWFDDSTQINKIELHSSTKEWEYIKNGVLLDESGEITLTENNKEYLEEIFKYIKNEWEEKQNLNNFDYSNFEQIEKFQNNLSFFGNEDILLRNEKAYGVEPYTKMVKEYLNKNSNEIKVDIICESNDFDIKFSSKQIIIKLADKIPLENCVLYNCRQNLCFANFLVKSDNKNSKISLFYSIKTQNFIDNFLPKIISKYIYENSDIIYLALFLKAENRNKDILAWFNSFKFNDGIKKFDEFIEKAAQLKDDKTLNEIREYVLLNNEKINSLNKNEEIFDYIKITQMNNNEQIYDKLQINSYDDLVQLMINLKSSGLKQSKFIKKYYPKFFSQISQIQNLQEISDVEITINKIRLLRKDILIQEKQKEKLDQIKSMINTIYNLTGVPINDIKNILFDSTIKDLINKQNNNKKKEGKKK
jgi:nucleotide binding protein PINc